MLFMTRDLTSTELCSTNMKWRCGHPSSYATMTLENGVPLAHGRGVAEMGGRDGDKE